MLQEAEDPPLAFAGGSSEGSGGEGDREATGEADEASSRASRRALCRTCKRIAANCICAALPATRPLPLSRCAGLKILILQHPAEAREFKNTVGILELCLPPGMVVIRRGKLFGAGNCPELAQALEAGRRGAAHLLFPDEGAARLADLAPAPGRPAPEWLVLLDGTWTACRRMMRGNAARLADLPRLALDPPGPSRHRIRAQPQARASSAPRAPQPEQEGYVCTLEAVAAVLAAAEGGEAGAALEAALLRPLDAVCATWAASAGWGHPDADPLGAR